MARPSPEPRASLMSAPDMNLNGSGLSRRGGSPRRAEGGSENPIKVARVGGVGRSGCGGFQ